MDMTVITDLQVCVYKCYALFMSMFFQDLLSVCGTLSCQENYGDGRTAFHAALHQVDQVAILLICLPHHGPVFCRIAQAFEPAFSPTFTVVGIFSCSCDGDRSGGRISHLNKRNCQMKQCHN